MKRTIRIEPINPEKQIHDIELELPNKCPHCGTAINEMPISSHFIHSPNIPSILTIGSIFFCPHCEHFFFADIIAPDAFRVVDGEIYSIYPASVFSTLFSENINSLSPRFVEIYHQAEIAESNNLHEICGSGYRKALEFLVKDFIISQNPDIEESVKTKLLGKCISDHIESPRIKSLSQASAWIGNDETHYVRKHEDYGLKELKAFINAVASHIDSELSVQAADDLISQSR